MADGAATTDGGNGGIVTAAVLVIGDEILSGRTKDKNIGYIAEYLTGIGIDLKEVRVVPDEEPEIVAALNALRARYTYVFTTGGIGPTHDDITADCVAKAFGVAARIPSARGRDHAGARRPDRRRDERGAHAHDARSGRRRTGAQQDLRRRRAFGSAMSSSWRASRASCRRCSTMSTPQLKTGARMLSETVRADSREGDIGTELGEIAKQYPDVVIGSYPFMDENNAANTNVVVRSRDPQKLAAAKAAVEAMLVRVKAELAAKA